MSLLRASKIVAIVAMIAVVAGIISIRSMLAQLDHSTRVFWIEAMEKEIPIGATRPAVEAFLERRAAGCGFGAEQWLGDTRLVACVPGDPFWGRFAGREVRLVLYLDGLERLNRQEVRISYTVL